MNPILNFFLVLGLTAAAFLLALSASASEKAVYADYFVSFKSRELSGDSSIWRYYQGDKVAWSGDLYSEPGSDRKQTSTPYYPLIGTYDTLDPEVLEYHILLAKLAGIDGFLCEYSLASGHDGQVPVLMAKLGKKYGFQVGVHWIPVNFTSWSGAADRDAMLAAAKKCLRFALKNIYSVSGAFVQGRPLVLIFNARAADYPADQVQGTHFSGRELQALREDWPGQAPWFLAWNYHHDPLDDFVDGYYPWVIPSGSPVPPGSRYDTIGNLDLQKERLAQFYQAAQKGIAEGKNKLFLAGVWPGFDDSRGRGWGEDLARFVPREDGRTLHELWAMAKASGAGQIMLETWNDWVESTIIEPSVEWGYRDLEACQREISEWKGMALDPASLRLPFRIYQLRKCLQRLQRSGRSESELAPLQQQTDEAAVSLGHSRISEAEDLILRVEKASGRLDQSVRKEKVVIRSEPAAPGRIKAAGRVTLAFPPEWRAKLAGRYATGRLTLAYRDDSKFWIAVSQNGMSGEKELARFLASGGQGWRTAEMDILATSTLDQAEFIFELENAGDRLGAVVWTLTLASAPDR